MSSETALSMIVAVVAVWLFIWIKRKQKAKAVELGIEKEFNENSARLGAFLSTAAGCMFCGLFLFNYYRGDIPPQNAPLVWFSVALIVLWVFFSWLKWLRLRRR